MALTYSYGIKNKYRPTGLITNAYGWGHGPQYNQADVPNGLSGLLGSVGLTSDQFMQQFAYEWFQSSALGGNGGLSNPPFVSGAAGRLHPALRDAETGGPARILRGYIRRAEREVGKPLDNARLYFMYNPETIQRDYVSYLDSAALDPFNTVFQSKNDVAPPSFMDFSFSLFFDRQEEATQADHPGVFVDYQFFDLVVRNVIPDDPLQSKATIPDNGVMMVNPRDITVIFSPQIMVQGRPLNANVSFDKFTHRMTPTRMTIRLTMRVIYIGPVKDQVEYTAEEQQSEAQIPIEEEKTDTTAAFGTNATSSSGNPEVDGKDSTRGMSFKGTDAEKANQTLREGALDWAIANTKAGLGAGRLEGSGDWTDYVQGAKSRNVPISCDCSGLVTMAYMHSNDGNGGRLMGWGDLPGTAVIKSRALANPTHQLYKPLTSDMIKNKELLRGDLLIGPHHIGFFVNFTGNADDPDIVVFDAATATSFPEVGARTYHAHGKPWHVFETFDHLLRPTFV